MRGVQRPISPQVLTKDSRPPSSCHQCTADVFLGLINTCDNRNGSGPPGGGTTARGGCPRQATAHIYLPNHGNVAREMQEKGDHRQESVWNVGAEKGPVVGGTWVS